MQFGRPLTTVLPKKSKTRPRIPDNPVSLATRFNEYFTPVGSSAAQKANDLVREHNFHIDPTMSTVVSIPDEMSDLFQFHSVIEKDVECVIHDTVSDLLPLKYGVPQRWILGPVLFTIYVNDLLSVPLHCKSACSVEDSKLYLSFPSTNTTTAIDNLNEDLKNICVWCCKTSLLINPDKTKVLFIGVPQLLRQLPAVPVLMLGKKNQSRHCHQRPWSLS